MSRTFGQRPQQDLHDNKTNCSLGRGIQTYFSIYTALHALTVILAKKWKKSKEIKVYFVFSLVSHNTRGQTARQQVCGHNPIETNSQSARSGTWLDAEFKNKNICICISGRSGGELTKLQNCPISATLPTYCLSAGNLRIYLCIN